MPTILMTATGRSGLSAARVSRPRSLSLARSLSLSRSRARSLSRSRAYALSRSRVRALSRLLARSLSLALSLSRSLALCLSLSLTLSLSLSRIHTRTHTHNQNLYFTNSAPRVGSYAPRAAPQQRSVYHGRVNPKEEENIWGAEPMGTNSLFMPRLTATDVQKGQVFRV